MRGALVLASCLLAAACGSAERPDDPAVAPLPEGLYEMRGTVVSVDRPRSIVLIDHEAIPGVMPAMTMPYEVADAALLDGLAAGDRVIGTLRVDSRGMVVVALSRL